MSMMTLLRRAFGFSPDSEEEEEDYDPTVPTYAAGEHRASRPPHEQHATAPTEIKSAPVPNTAAEKTSGTESLPADLFDAVIAVFNEAQPDFVKKCLDTEAQRKYLIDSIDSRLREQVENATKTSADRWKEEKTRLESRIAELEGDDNAIAVLRKENRRLQLSVDRQKRALLDRINDLESQVARQDEEKERFYSHRKPNTSDEELSQAKARIEELEAAIASNEEALKNQVSAGDADPETVSEQERQIAERDSRIAELTAECDKLREEAARQSTLREQLEVKTSMSDNMINDLRNQAAAARRELETMQEEQLQAVEQIQKEIDAFEDLKARKDAKISELQDSNASLRRTIETNLYNQANSEMRLRKEIKDLQAQLDAAKNAVESDSAVSEPYREDESASADSAKAAEKSSARRRGRPRKVKIDSSLDNTDWFSGGKHDDPDFGYHEPPRKPVNDNEAQLSLF